MQADIVYYSGHGVHDTGVLREIVAPSGVSNYWHDVDIVVIAGCAVLDIDDKSGHYSNPASHAASPGRKWLAASGANVLLGYAYKAPRDNQGGTEIVRSWSALRNGNDDAAAWMQANDNMNGRNACAIKLLPEGKIEYRYFKRDGRGWNIRSKHKEIVEEINL